MAKHLQNDLNNLKEASLALAAEVEESVRMAVTALEERNASLAGRVIDYDHTIDKKEVALEEDCLKILALHQPVAIDLRFVVAVLKINNDLERIGDHGVNIAQSAALLAGRPAVKVLADIPWMAGLAVSMLKDSLDSFISANPEKAREVCTRDDQVDDLKDQILSIVLTFMMENPGFISEGMTLILVARNLERIADLATDISEEAIYIHQGKVIKHGAEQQSEEGEATR